MIYLSIGSNVGDRLKNLQHAIHHLRLLGSIVAISSVYETEPWGNTDQDNFYNASVAFDSSLEPLELLMEIKSIEERIGREYRERWGPREIDIDIILWHNNSIVILDTLEIPHKYYAERAFVIVPTLEVAKQIADSKTEELLNPIIQKLSITEVQKLQLTL